MKRDRKNDILYNKLILNIIHNINLFKNLFLIF